MNSRLRNELSVITATTAALAYMRGRPKLSAGLALLTLGLGAWRETRPFSYLGKHVLITGGSRGLGFAMARQLVGDGARVSLLARDQDELCDAVTQLEAKNPDCAAAYSCDITKRNEFMLAINSAISHFGPLDMIVNNAGAIVVGPFETLDRDDFDAQMRIHFDCIVEVCRQLVPYFKTQGSGRIVNITSVGAKFGIPHMSAYCASKFALAGFSASLAAELAPHGIHVTTVYPGLMRTGSAIQAIFKGDHDKEFAWFVAGDNMPALSMSPDRAARRILEAARDGQSELVLSIPAKMGIAAQSIFPELTAKIIGLVAALMPHGKSFDRKMGAELYSRFRAHLWARPFAKAESEAQVSYNQVAKGDADYNLGI